MDDEKQTPSAINEHVLEQPRDKSGRFLPQPTRKVRRAIDLMIWEGICREDAAQRAGLKPQSLQAALRRENSLRYMRTQYEALRTSAPFRAYARQELLAETARSEDVRERANRWIAGVDGLAPVSKHSVQAHVTHGFAGYEYRKPRIQADAKDAEIVDDDS